MGILWSLELKAYSTRSRYGTVKVVRRNEWQLSSGDQIAGTLGAFWNIRMSIDINSRSHFVPKLTRSCSGVLAVRSLILVQCICLLFHPHVNAPSNPTSISLTPQTGWIPAASREFKEEPMSGKRLHDHCYRPAALLSPPTINLLGEKFRTRLQAMATYPCRILLTCLFPCVNSHRLPDYHQMAVTWFSHFSFDGLQLKHRPQCGKSR